MLCRILKYELFSDLVSYLHPLTHHLVILVTPSGFPGSLEKLEVLAVLDLNTHNVHFLLNLPTVAIVS